MVRVFERVWIRWITVEVEHLFDAGHVKVLVFGCNLPYYKVRQLFLLQSATTLLQSATVVAKCDGYYKVQQYTTGVGKRWFRVLEV